MSVSLQRKPNNKNIPFFLPHITYNVKPTDYNQQVISIIDNLIKPTLNTLQQQDNTMTKTLNRLAW
jgi:hypothetical protein